MRGPLPNTKALRCYVGKHTSNNKVHLSSSMIHQCIKNLEYDLKQCGMLLHEARDILQNECRWTPLYDVS